MAPPVPNRDSERFERCFTRNYGDVARYCARRAPTSMDAEDAAVEVFAVAWRRVRDLPAEPEDRLWLFGVARRVLANAARAEHRRSRLLSRLTASARARVAPGHAGSEAADLAAGLASLRAPDRELLLLAAWEGLTPAEIGLVLDLAPAVVSRRLHRARGRLAAALGTPDRGDGHRSPPATEGGTP